MISYPHPMIYTLLHHLKFTLLPPPYRYTPTHAPGYWIDTFHERASKISRLEKPFPYPLQKASVNSMRDIDCLMVGPGALVIQTPATDDLQSIFHRLDVEKIFKNYPAGELVLVTGVKPWDAIWEPIKPNNHPILYPWSTDPEIPGLCMPLRDGPDKWDGPEVGIFQLDLSLPNTPLSRQSTTSAPSTPSRERHSTSTARPTAWAC